MFKLALVATSALAMTACTYSSHGPEDDHSVESAGMIASRNIDVTGDAEFAGMIVRADGKVGRDLELAGATVRSNMEVGGDLSVAGARVNFRGSVAGTSDVATASGNLDADFQGDLNVAAARITIDGRVGGRLEANTARIHLRGEFDGPVLLIGEGNDQSGHAIISGHLAQGGTICATEIEFRDEARVDGELILISDDRPENYGGSYEFRSLDGRDCDDLNL
jgi:cytoskeletal protein CcmA (bactofilin family)